MFFIIAPFQSPLISCVEICLYFSFLPPLFSLYQRGLCSLQSHNEKWDCKTLTDLSSWWSRSETLFRLSGGPSGGGDKRDVAPANNAWVSEWCQLTVACTFISHDMPLARHDGLLCPYLFLSMAAFLCLVWDLKLGVSSFEIRSGWC